MDAKVGRDDDAWRQTMSRGLAEGLHVLEIIAEAGPGGIAQAEIAKQTGRSEATVSRHVTVLESEEYVERLGGGVRMTRRAAQLWLSYRKGLKVERATIDAELRATTLLDEPENGGVE